MLPFLLSPLLNYQCLP